MCQIKVKKKLKKKLRQEKKVSKVVEIFFSNIIFYICIKREEN